MLQHFLALLAVILHLCLTEFRISVITPQKVAPRYLGDQISLHPVKLLCNKPVLESRASCTWCNHSQPPLARISTSSPQGCVRYLCTHTCCCERRSLSLPAYPSPSRAQVKFSPTLRKSSCGLAVPQGVKEL